MKKPIIFLFILITLICSSCVLGATSFYDTRDTKYEGVVERITTLKIVNGVSETTFAPNKNITRAELAKIIVKMQRLDEIKGIVPENPASKFTDVKSGEWYFDYVYIASNLGILNGYEDGTFRPNNNVTYAEVVAMMLRFLGYTNIKNDSEVWYKNYLVKMRQLELNEDVGEQKYDSYATRGDVAIFVWNTLITNQWSISQENIYSGFSYSTSEKTPLETYFDDYTYLDNASIRRLGGTKDGVGVWVGNKFYVSTEVLPLYIKGARITALVKDDKMSGISYDDNVSNIKVISGPAFYLKDQGYKLSSAKQSFSFGNKDKASYVYMLIDVDTNSIIRTVYLDSSDYVIVENVSLTKSKSGDEDDSYTLKLNDMELDYDNCAVMKNGLYIPWSNVSKGDCLIYIEEGLYIAGISEVSGVMTDYSFEDDTISIDYERYAINDDCECYFYTEKEPIPYSDLSTSKLKSYIDVDVKAYLNVAEEIFKLEFSKNEEENRSYEVGFVTLIYAISSGEQRYRVNFGTNERQLRASGYDNFADIGDLIVVSKEDGVTKITEVTKDENFKNDIGVKYYYDAKKYEYPMIGEYMVTADTNFYKVTLTYKDNSASEIEKCTVEGIEVNKNLKFLEGYDLVLVYDEYMEILTAFLVNDMNKFESQIALVRGLRSEKSEKTTKEYVSLSVVNGVVSGYLFDIADKENLIPGEIITYKFMEGKDDSQKISLVDYFNNASIGYKRDLIVKEYDSKNKIVMFENGEDMDLSYELYDFSGRTINLNKFRFVLGNVLKEDGEWCFTHLELINPRKFTFQKGDRIAIGELNDVIVVYRGYEE